MKNKLLSLLSFLFIVTLMCSSAQAATITVTERADSFGANLCSLRDAVEFMNTDGMATNTGCSATGTPGISDTIILEGGAPYTVSIPNTGGANNADGDLDIIVDLVIQGQGIDATTITGAFADPLSADRIFETDNDVDVSFIGMTISNGGGLDLNFSGGGILIGFVDQVTLQAVRVSNNQADDGGGIFNDGSLILQQSVVAGNEADGEGGGIFNLGSLALNESTIDNNQAGFGGGGIISIFGTSLFIDNSTISNNRAIGGVAQGSNGDGGGIFISTTCDTTVIQNSTISTNDAFNRGGGIFVGSDACVDAGLSIGGQGVAPQGIFLLNDTITLNQALNAGGQGGGIWFVIPEVPASLPGAAGVADINLANTILAQNDADSGPDCFTDLNSFGFNLLGSTSGCDLFNSDPAGHPDQLGEANPGLGPLKDNGGPTLTHGLFVDSPAIDRGNNIPGQGCTVFDFIQVVESGIFDDVPLIRDQRNFLRPIAVRDPNTPICDVGAFEFQVFDFTVTKDDGLAGAEIEVGTNFDYTISVTNNGPGTATNVTLNDPLPAGMAFVAVTPSQGTCSGGATISCDLGDLAAGETATIVVSVTATETGNFTNIVTITLNNPVQQQLTETAQVTTSVTGVFVEGSGIHCELQRDATAAASPRHAAALLLMALVVFGGYSALRRRAHP